MKLRSRWLIPYAATLIAWAIRLWLATMRLHRAFGSVEHPLPKDGRRYIYAFWHESMLCPLKLKWNGRMLIGEHFDGEIIAQICLRLGIPSVRGSKRRGGSRALLKIIREETDEHLGITPDGPKGPRRQLKPGTVMASSYTGMPIVPCGMAFSRAVRCSSWDRFALPVPFTTMVIVFGEAIEVPPDLNRQQLPEWTDFVNGRMAEATAQAEAWIERIQRDGSRAAPPALTAALPPLRKSA